MARPRKKALEPGYEGREFRVVPVQITATRTEDRIARNRPGDFYWRYNRRKSNSALLHAGIKFAELWERAGIASVTAPNMEGGSTVGWRGLPDGRTVAMDEIRGLVQDVGKLGSARLHRYCVNGETASEIAAQFGIPDRDMAAILEMDLRSAALSLKYL